MWEHTHMEKFLKPVDFTRLKQSLSYGICIY
jgi:hypothetical protein